MNIFYLDRDPVIAAQMMCDKHVVKMILESAQMLSTAHRVLDGDEYATRWDYTNWLIRTILVPFGCEHHLKIIGGCLITMML